MELPFTEGQFLDVFGAYNRALWPLVALLWTASLFALLATARRRDDGRLIAGLLAAHWLWSGIAYHLVFFRHINPAALGFGVLFVAEALLLIWRGVLRRELSWGDPPRWARVAGMTLIGYSFVYPAVGLLFGLTYPRMPMYGVPCPTTLLTVGVLLLASRHEARILGVMPLIWTAVGGSAAFVLGIGADLVLPLAGVVILLRMALPIARGYPAPQPRHGT